MSASSGRVKRTVQPQACGSSASFKRLQALEFPYCNLLWSFPLCLKTQSRSSLGAQSCFCGAFLLAWPAILHFVLLGCGCEVVGDLRDATAIVALAVRRVASHGTGEATMLRATTPHISRASVVHRLTARFDRDAPWHRRRCASGCQRSRSQCPQGRSSKAKSNRGCRLLT